MPGIWLCSGQWISDMADEKPKSNGENGRTKNGTFAPGNKAASGRPQAHANAVMAWKKTLYETITPQDFADVTRVLIENAKAGEAWAVKEFYDRCLGKAPASVDVTTDGETMTFLDPVAAAILERALDIAEQEEDDG